MCKNSADSRFTPQALQVRATHGGEVERKEKETVSLSVCACVLENCNSYNLCCQLIIALTGIKSAYVRLTCRSLVMVKHGFGSRHVECKQKAARRRCAILVA